jgi:hypothetical protein
MPTVIITTNSPEWNSAFSGQLKKSETPGKVSIRCTSPIRLPNGVTFVPAMTFPYAPNSISISDMSDAYEQLERAGREPLLYRSQQKLMSVELGLVMTAPTAKGYDQAESNISWLRVVARSDRDISVVGLGEIMTGRLFRITDISVRSQRMNVKQQITIAEVGVSLTEVHYDERQKIPGLIVIKDIPPPAQQASGGGGGRTEAPNSELWPQVSGYWT